MGRFTESYGGGEGANEEIVVRKRFLKPSKVKSVSGIECFKIKSYICHRKSVSKGVIVFWWMWIFCYLTKAINFFMKKQDGIKKKIG